MILICVWVSFHLMGLSMSYKAGDKLNCFKDRKQYLSCDNSTRPKNARNVACYFGKALGYLSIKCFDSCFSIRSNAFDKIKFEACDFTNLTIQRIYSDTFRSCFGRNILLNQVGFYETEAPFGLDKSSSIKDIHYECSAKFKMFRVILSPRSRLVTFRNCSDRISGFKGAFYQGAWNKNLYTVKLDKVVTGLYFESLVDSFPPLLLCINSKKSQCFHFDHPNIILKQSQFMSIRKTTLDLKLILTCSNHNIKDDPVVIFPKNVNWTVEIYSSKSIVQCSFRVKLKNQTRNDLVALRFKTTKITREKQEITKHNCYSLSGVYSQSTKLRYSINYLFISLLLNIYYLY